MNDKTTFLFARPSFIEGVARTLDIGGTLQSYNISDTGDLADAIALYLDGAAIGDDLRAAIEAIAEAYGVSLE